MFRLPALNGRSKKDSAVILVTVMTSFPQSRAATRDCPITLVIAIESCSDVQGTAFSPMTLACLGSK